MAVPSSQRTVPALQYVTTAKDIAYQVEPVTERYPARQWNSMGRFMVEDASLALRNVLLVDSIYLRTEDDLQREYQLLDEALGYYAHLEVMTDLSIRAFKRINREIDARQAEEDARAAAEPGYSARRLKRKGPTEKQILAIAVKIAEERDLIAGIKRKAPNLLAQYQARKAKRERERQGRLFDV